MLEGPCGLFQGGFGCFGDFWGLFWGVPGGWFRDVWGLFWGVPVGCFRDVWGLFLDPVGWFGDVWGLFWGVSETFSGGSLWAG